MTKSAVTLTLESVSHDEFMKVANEVRRQLEAGNKVVLECGPNVSELSVRNLLIGRYLKAETVTKLVIKSTK